MPHFQNQREDAMAMSDQNAKLDRIIVLLEELTGHSRKAMDHAERQAEQEKEVARKAYEQKVQSQNQNENQRKAAQARPPQTPYPLGPAPESPSLFGASDPLSAQGRNETMASQSALEQQSQQENTFHRDVQAKD